PLITPPTIPGLEYAVQQYAHNPLRFVLETFDWQAQSRWKQPFDWQLDVLEDMTHSLQENDSIYRLAVASGKGVGKTAMLAWLFLWHVGTHPESQTTLTSVTGRQSNDRSWREIRKWYRHWSLRHHFRIQSTHCVALHDETWAGSYLTWSIDRLES